MKRGKLSVSDFPETPRPRQGWLAPSPVPGHGPHRYAFQLFAADAIPAFQHPPSRGQLIRALRPHLLAAARLIGVYQRE